MTPRDFNAALENVVSCATDDEVSVTEYASLHDALREDFKSLFEAFHRAVDSPKGVVPACGEAFYYPEFYRDPLIEKVAEGIYSADKLCTHSFYNPLTLYERTRQKTAEMEAAEVVKLLKAHDLLKEES